MNQKNIRYILLAAVIILATVFFILNRNKKVEYDWTENYREESRHPYGTYVVHEMLKTHFENKEFTKMDTKLSENMPSETDEVANYVFIGEGMFLDSADLQTLLSFAENGNNVFIAAKSYPEELMDGYLYDYSANCGEFWEGLDTYRDTAMSLNFYHENLVQDEGTVFKYARNNEVASYRWHYFNEDYFCGEYYGDDYYESESFLSIGEMDDYEVNFVKVPYGEGSFYLHCTPLAFTNYHMIEEYGLDYANKVFAHLEEGDIYWDAFNHVGEVRPRNNEDELDRLFEPVSLSDESPLEYILSQDSLRWAWYLLLVLGALYLIFRAKRRQRIIPVNEPNTNTSLEFIESIGRLYFQQNNHKKLEEQKMKLFLGFIRERYNLPVHNIDNELIDKLIVVSGVSEQKVKAVFALYESHSKKPEIFEEQLINFHQAMDYFYKNCK